MNDPFYPRRGFENPWAACFGAPDGAGSPMQMTGEIPDAGSTGSAANPEPAMEKNDRTRELPIINLRGLHARASAKFVQTAEKFDADIKVSRGGETVGGRSIMGLMMLAAARGTSISVSASGPEAFAALDAIEALVASKFGEEA